MIARAVSTTRRRWPLLLAGVFVLTSVLFAGLARRVSEFDAVDSRIEEGNPVCATGFVRLGSVEPVSSTGRSRSCTPSAFS
jgi:hypothetical protein